MDGNHEAWLLEHSGAHIDSRPGRDTSLHPEIPLCNEAGGGGIDMPTTLVEEYGMQNAWPLDKSRWSLEVVKS